MQAVYNAAMRAPDHAWLRPTRFIEIKGKGLDKLSKIFENFVIHDMNLEDEFLINKYKMISNRLKYVD